MKILLATDGSPCSQAAVNEICACPWPADSVVKVVSVAHTRVPEGGDPFFLTMAIHVSLLEDARKRAAALVESASREIRERAHHLQVEQEALEGSPKKEIVEEAERWGADLILLGSHGYGPMKRFLLGSVSQAVAAHAHCSVEIVRCRRLLASAEVPREQD